MPARVTVLCSYERESSLTVPLIKWVCKWELVNCQGNLTKLVRGGVFLIASFCKKLELSSVLILVKPCKFVERLKPFNLT